MQVAGEGEPLARRSHLVAGVDEISNFDFLRDLAEVGGFLITLNNCYNL
jgi:hypothetical protein